MNALSQNTKITSTDINTLISELNGKLNLSGGVMTGALYFGAVGSMGISDNADYRTLWINRNSGNAIGIFDTDSPSNPGTLLLRASNGSSSSDFWLYPDGNATLGSHSVLTSAGGAIDFVNLPGSSRLKGEFGYVDGNWFCETNLGYTQEVSGAKLILRRGDSSAFEQNGMAGLMAQHSDGRANYFLVYPDGTAYVNNSQVITSAGGTMTGYIKHNVGDILSNIADNQWTSIKGGSGHNKGAAVTLYGQDYNDGQAELIAYKDGVGTQKINIHPSNGVTTDKIHTSELEIKYSKLYFQGDVDTFITRNWDTTNGYYYLVMQAGTWGSCGRVEVYDNESPHEAGAVALIAADKRFVVYPNGIARMNGELQANYLYMHPQNNDKEGGELKLAASNSNLHHIICDNYNDNFRILFQNSSGAVPYIYNFSKDGRISTPTGSFWIA